MSNYIDDRDGAFFDPDCFKEDKPTKKPRITKMTAAQLSVAQFPEVKFIVPNLIPTGLTVLASSPKIGKSWMVLQIAERVATGSKVFGEFETEASPVLYLALEDNLRRMKERLAKINALPSDNLTIETERLRGPVAIVYIQNWIDITPNPKLIIIDTFGRFRGESKKNQQLYDSDTAALAPLQDIASKHDLAIILVHHTKKGITEDFTQSVSGSQGITGVADTIMRLERKRGENDGILDITGRDIEEQQLPLRWDQQTGLWMISDYSTAAINASDEQKRVINLFSTIAKEGDRDSCAIVPAIVAAYLGKEKQATFDLLKRMKQRGIIEQVGGKGSGYRLRSSEFKW